MRILIATGIYPPEIGGPAEYAKNIADVWRAEGHTVDVKVFSAFNWLPTGIRHLVYLFSLFPKVIIADFILILDTFSAALPTVILGRLLGKKMIVRTGGDFLWEGYVERTGKLVLLRDFYHSELHNLSLKEKITFFLIRFVLKNIDAVIWSTEWQRDIFIKPYGLEKQKHFVIENYYGERIAPKVPAEKNFIASARALKWKNFTVLKDVFNRQDVRNAGGVVDTKPVSHADFLEKISRSYAVILVSLGDISPNTILDAIRCQKPFILTKENGLTPRIKDVALFVDPKNLNDIKEKVLWLCDEKNYAEQKKKVEAFSFVHSWEDVAKEYLAVYKNIQ